MTTILASNDIVIFDTSLIVDGQPLKMVAKRYSSSFCTKAGTTLLLAHGNGTHKEQWEPTLERLFNQQEADSSDYIREAWSFDWHTHGDSGVLNSKVLDTMPNGVSISEWGKAIAQFAMTHLSSRKIIAIGHSAGASAIVYSTKCYSTGYPNPYCAIILVEPPFIDRDVYQEHLDERKKHEYILQKIVSSQRSSWDDPESAFEWLQSRPPWNIWDERVLRVFVNKGLKYAGSHGSHGAVVTKCSKIHESASFFDLDATLEALDMIEVICGQIPTHVIFGDKNDIVPRYFQAWTERRKLASVTRIGDAGHMVVQQRPDELASTIRIIMRRKPEMPRL